jgi:hypothetical protein
MRLTMRCGKGFGCVSRADLPQPPFDNGTGHALGDGKLRQRPEQRVHRLQ